MIYNTNTGSALYRTEDKNFQSSSRRLPSTTGSTQYSYETFAWQPPGGGSVPTRKGSQYSFDPITFNPYAGHLSIRKHPNVNYGPGEDPTYAFNTLDKNVEMWQSQTSPYLKMADPLGRSVYTKESAGGTLGPMGGEASLIQIQQTMREITNRAAIESTAASNRNIPPAARVTNVTPIQNIVERIIPGTLNNAKTQLVWPTKMPMMLGASPNVSSANYYDTVTGQIDSWFSRIPRRQPPPELIEDVLEENMKWKERLKQGADYDESPDTKDKTKETIKTIKDTGEIVTTTLKPSSFDKTKEYDTTEQDKEKEQMSMVKRLQQGSSSELISQNSAQDRT